MPFLPCPPLTIESGPSPEITLLFVHGLGTRGANFAPLADTLARTLSCPIRLLLPTAPRRPVTIYGNPPVTAWFDLPDPCFTLREDVAGLRAAQACLTALIQAEIRRGTAPGRIVIAGFSQGGALSLLTGLSFPERLGGIAALSGWLPLSATLAGDYAPAARDTPVFIGHGTQDRITPLSMAVATRDWLAAHRGNVMFRTYPAGHALVEDEITDMARWIKDRLTQNGDITGKTDAPL